MNDSDRLLLEATIELAEQGRFTCAPNPTVGCIIVRDGEIIGRGFHKEAGQGHAEVEAIRAAEGDVEGATVYVSLEPCAFTGRTPACSKTLIEAGVARVVMAMLDPHPKVSGQGVADLREAGIDVDVADMAEAHELIRGYRSVLERGRPWVTIKSASSLDGATALASGESKWITGEAARKDVQYWRARSDAIVTGIGTVLNDDPALTVRDHEAKQPLRVILDHTLRTPESARIVNDGGETLLVHAPGTTGSNAFSQHTGVSCLGLDTGDLSALLAELAERGCNEVLVEAGPGVVGSFVEAGLWDEWVAYIAPAIMGDESAHLVHAEYKAMSEIPRAEVVETTMIGSDVRLKIRRNTP